MNQALLSGIASKAYDKLLKATESKQPIAVTGLPDTMAAYIASKLCADTGKKVLLISGNDLKAAHDAEDGQQLLAVLGVVRRFEVVAGNQQHLFARIGAEF